MIAKRKKIMLLANNDIWLYKLRKEIILKLIEENYEVVISCPDGDYIQEMVNWGCIFVETKVDRRGTNPTTDLKLLISYIKVLKQVKPDVVLTYTIKPNLYGGLACRILKVPCINNITGLGSGFSKSPILKFFLSTLYKVSLKKSACVFFQNTQDMQTLVENGIVKGTTKLIPGSGVNLQEYTLKEFPEEDNASFIFIGRIMKDKGIDQYLEAAKIIKQKYPETTFQIIGFVEETQPLYKELIKEYEDKKIISFLGYQADVKPFIKKAHCIIQASHGGEGMSNVLLETAATGRVLIASDIPGCRETIDEEVNGFIFEPQNTNSLTQRIEQYLKLTYEEKKKMGLNSRKKIEKEFDRNIVVEAYLKEINEAYQ
ncbi:glycosyltransferase family 4 protein [Planococcus liqunii]|uniref:glycosyltransferase family 4 protein n=1 Tax=Planococcus liqunii TaxID=3058394 RepID=UPI002614B78E|nr:glycosyltransferase family 4 protein [Planococcus sp. N056]WKA50220.1 glycosyltransferase family 4 protein [Planococcus sp. N056]